MMIMPSQTRWRYMSIPGPVLLPQWYFPLQISSVKYDANSFYLIFSGAIHFIASNNDCGVRDFDMENFELYKHFHFAWPVNVRVLRFPSLVIRDVVSFCQFLSVSFSESGYLCVLIWLQHTSLSPDGKLLVVVGDDPDGILVDAKTGKVISSSTSSCLLSSFNHLYLWLSSCLPEYSLQTIKPLRGHLDFSFASEWHPDGVTFATGNQDKTCRIWDIRNLSKSIAVLKGNLGAIRSIRYTSDGQYMAMAEPADFVHVYDTKTGYKKEQEIDFFGEISGMSFSPDTESLFIGVWDRTYGSLLEYGRRRNFWYLDSLIWAECAVHCNNLFFFGCAAFWTIVCKYVDRAWCKGEFHFVRVKILYIGH